MFNIFYRIGFVYFFCFSLHSTPLEFSIKGDAAVLMNAETGTVLFEIEGRKPLYPASTTKIATALYALQINPDGLDFPVVVPGSALTYRSEDSKRKSNYAGEAAYRLEQDGTHMRLMKDEVLSFEDLLKGMLTCSANDAANVIAEELGPGIPLFMERVNDYLKSIGCADTRFTNPHGLHDPSHRTTAYDLAVMTREALKNPTFCSITCSAKFNRPKTNKQGPVVLQQTNRLLRPGPYYYSKAIGVKTGYHSKAKKTFVAAARSGDRTLILVLMGYSDKNRIFKDAIDLFEIAFNQPKTERTYLSEGMQSFTRSFPKANGPLRTYLSAPLALSYYPSEDPEAKCFLHWDSISLPIVKGQRVGEVRLVDPKGDILQTASLSATEGVDFAWPYNGFSYLSLPVWIAFFILFSGFVYFFMRRD